MFDDLRLGLNDEELDDYRDYDDEHSERGSKLDEVGADEDDETEEIIIVEASVVVPPEAPPAAESKPEPAPPANFAHGLGNVTRIGETGSNLRKEGSK